MCFSASASFGAGVVLTVIGIASIKKTTSRSQIPFASVPLLFAVQQITEGFEWLALSNSAFASLRWITCYSFLFFAQVAWPIWVPYAILKLEPKEKRKKSEIALVCIGTLLAAYLGYCLINYPVSSEIEGRHISYKLDYPASLATLAGALYIIATIAPPFFSRIRRMWMLGTAILISYIMTTIFYEDYIVSVWCFFASIISIAVFAIMQEIKNSPDGFIHYKIRKAVRPVG
jgi:hypothetical protein